MISVIIPVYNIEQYIEQAVRSVLEQTYSDIEVIAVDDGSTDESGEICDRLAEEDPRIRVIHKPNGGLSSARNAGLDETRGEYIAFLDGDDYFTPDALQYLIDLQTETGADLVFASEQCVNDRDEAVNLD